jgi:hypothetical protein
MAGGIENPWKYQVSKGFCFINYFMDQVKDQVKKLGTRRIEKNEKFNISETS